MSISNYTYLGPIIKINDTIKMKKIRKFCPDETCVNASFNNNLNGNDQFCPACGKSLESKEVNISYDFSLENLKYIDKEFEEYEDHFQTPEDQKNIIILNKHEVKGFGYHLDSDQLNIKMFLRGTFEDNFSNFENNDFYNNFLHLLTKYFEEGSFRVNYGLITFSNY